jgi:uncharacterized RDD family membrane protein YckC
MKCQKCGYLGFEYVDRCRNCGYQFSLESSSSAALVPDLAIRGEAQTLRPLDDLSLVDAAMAAGPEVPVSDAGPALEGLFGVPATRAAAVPSSGDLPLFDSPSPDDEALITKASAPRPPLAVRRSTPDVPRLRARSRLQSLDLALERKTPASRPETRAPAARAGAAAAPFDATAQDAPMGARLAAVVIDVLILSFIDAVVVYFTMQICGITLQELDLLPMGPLVAFLFVQNGGYLVAFTAGGQTLGKMAAGIRVVPVDADTSLDLGRAFLRTLMWLVLAVPVGLGFLSALFARDHRGLHDRFAGTRVVR